MYVCIYIYIYIYISVGPDGREHDLGVVLQLRRGPLELGSVVLLVLIIFVCSIV